MAVDRTTKILLLAIAVGLWGLLLRPAFSPAPAQAQAAAGAQPAGVPALTVAREQAGDRVFLAQDGNVFIFYPSGNVQAVQSRQRLQQELERAERLLR